MSIVELAARLVVRALIVTAPFLIASGGVFVWLLTEFDINFYLSQRPPELFVAAGLIGALTVAAAVLLLPRIVSWAYALPIQLFEERRPADAIAASVERTRGLKREITATVVSWMVVSVVLSMVSFGVLGAVARVVVPRAKARSRSWSS